MRHFFRWFLLLDEPHLGSRKGGVNDLSMWEDFGGYLKRPEPPAPMRKGTS